MTRFIHSHSLNQDDDPILDQIALHLWKLTQDQQVGLAIAALYEGFEPCSVEFDYCCCTSYRFDECVSLLQHLSLLGKLALARSITEHLAVVETAGQGRVELPIPKQPQSNRGQNILMGGQR